MSKNTKKMFETYYLELREGVYWYVYRKLNKQEISEDITTEVFMKLLKNEEVLLKRDRNGIRAWLFTVARNQIIDMFRKNSKKDSKNVDLDEEIFEIVASKDDDYMKQVIKEEEAEMVISLVEGLEKEEKEVIHLRFYEEMKFSEIGEVLGKKEGAVKMILYRGLEKIKNKAGDRLKDIS